MKHPEQRPPLCAAGHVVVVSESWPPRPGGASTVMRNLLACFDPASYSVVTAASTRRGAIEAGDAARVHRVLSSLPVHYRLNRWWRGRQLARLAPRIRRIVKSEQPRAIVGVYPDLHFLAATAEVADASGTPWIAYLHDTIAETEASGPNAAWAEDVQTRVFAEAGQILVMSQGMAELYARKYALTAQPLEHSHAEPIPERPPEEPPRRQAFWAGSFHEINVRAAARVSRALAAADVPFVITTNWPTSALAASGIGGSHVRVEFHHRRSAVLALMREQGILVLAVDWPDESPMHADELATIFPTKTPEYLAAGRPILVHCPGDYFLARFFRERGCGLVITDRSQAALIGGIEHLLAGGDQVDAMRRAALLAARLFAAERVATAFRTEVERVARGERAVRAISETSTGVPRAGRTSAAASE